MHGCISNAKTVPARRVSPEKTKNDTLVLNINGGDKPLPPTQDNFGRGCFLNSDKTAAIEVMSLF